MREQWECRRIHDGRATAVSAPGSTLRGLCASEMELLRPSRLGMRRATKEGQPLRRGPFPDARSRRDDVTTRATTHAHGRRRRRAISCAVRLMLRGDDARPVRSTVVMTRVEAHGVTARTAPPCCRRRFSALINPRNADAPIDPRSRQRVSEGVGAGGRRWRFTPTA